MALTTCKECKKDISTTAKSCPNCGAENSGSFIYGLLKSIVFTIISVSIVLFIISYLAFKNPVGNLQTGSKCNISDFSVKINKIGFVDKCRTHQCFHMQGTGTIENNCSSPYGVNVKLIAYDKDDNIVAVDSGWPASIKNIPTGKYHFSFDQWIDYDPSIKKYSVEINEIKEWQN